MPHISPDESLPMLLMDARRLLTLTQEGLGTLLGASRRTSGRWESRRSTPSMDQLNDLARAVHPKDRGLAARIAEQTGSTLVSLGLEAPPMPPGPAAPPPRVLPPIALLVESVVCAAAEALDSKPAAVREVLRAAFHRARAMSLTVEEVDEVLTPSPPAAEPPRAKAAAAKMPPV
jgi:DNA-binding XRE family transcriptional regulator